jgi:hypothetical protein
MTRRACAWASLALLGFAGCGGGSAASSGFARGNRAATDYAEDLVALQEGATSGRAAKACAVVTQAFVARYERADRKSRCTEVLLSTPVVNEVVTQVREEPQEGGGILHVGGREATVTTKLLNGTTITGLLVQSALTAAKPQSHPSSSGSGQAPAGYWLIDRLGRIGDQSPAPTFAQSGTESAEHHDSRS